MDNKEKRQYQINKNLNDRDIARLKKTAGKREDINLHLFSLALAINKQLSLMGKSQEWLTEKTGVSKATISAYCNAESLPNGINLLKLAEALNTTPNYLLGFTEVATPDIDIQAIHHKTGLSEEAINILSTIAKNVEITDSNGVKFEKPEVVKAPQELSDLIEHNSFLQLLSQIHLIKTVENTESAAVENYIDLLGESKTRELLFYTLNKIFNGIINDICPYTPSEDSHTRQATQHDIDRF